MRNSFVTFLYLTITYIVDIIWTHYKYYWYYYQH